MDFFSLINIALLSFVAMDILYRRPNANCASNYKVKICIIFLILGYILYLSFPILFICVAGLFLLCNFILLIGFFNHDVNNEYKNALGTGNPFAISYLLYPLINVPYLSFSAYLYFNKKYDFPLTIKGTYDVIFKS
jgi:hypothetical protein